MKKFKDANGREWSISINLGTLMKVKSLTGFDLSKIFDDDYVGIAKLYDDLFLMADVLWEVVDQTGATKEEFVPALMGDIFDDAASALVEEMVDFFPSPKTRQVHRAAIRKTWEVVDTVQDEMTAKINAIDPTSFFSAGNSPGSSA